MGRAALHREADVRVFAAALRPGVWRDAATLAAAGSLAEAADLTEEAGELPPAALYRLHALEVATLEVTAHRVFADPECPACRGRR